MTAKVRVMLVLPPMLLAVIVYVVVGAVDWGVPLMTPLVGSINIMNGSAGLTDQIVTAPVTVGVNSQFSALEYKQPAGLDNGGSTVALRQEPRK